MTVQSKSEVRRGLRVTKPVPALLILLLLTSAALTALLYLTWHRTDEQIDSDAAAVVSDAARSGTVALLSYSPETVDDDLATARSHLTGDFLTEFEDFAHRVVAPASKQKALKTTVDVVGAAVAELHPDSAVVLTFVNQTTTSKDQPDPSIAARSLRVSLSKVDGSWLIAKFDGI